MDPSDPSAEKSTPSREPSGGGAPLASGSTAEQIQAAKHGDLIALGDVRTRFFHFEGSNVLGRLAKPVLAWNIRQDFRKLRRLL